jgi:uncharacterized membrane protein YfcA
MDVLLIPSGLGFIIGMTLGLLGGGGSILTVPALVYVIGQTPQVAVTASLMIVGANSALGAMFHRAEGTLNWRVALIFGGTGMITAYAAAGLSSLFSPTLLMVMFALLMMAVGTLMMARPAVDRQNENFQQNVPVVIIAGAGVGVLTGFLGVGGGFLIVPALVMLVGLPMQQAVGTSLIIIAMNSLAGLLGHLGESAIDLNMILIFVITGVAGTLVGTKLAQHIESKHLQKLFAVFIIGLAIFLLIDNMSKITL